MRFVISIVIIVALSLAVYTVGMRIRGNPSLQTRIDTTVHEGQSAYRAYSRVPDSVQAVVLKKILDQLDNATPLSLQQPTLIIAYIVKRPSKRDKLVVNWIGAKPGIKQICLFSDNGTKVFLKIPPGQKSYNKAQSYAKVVYTVMLKLNQNSPADKLIKKIGANNIQINMIKPDGTKTNTVKCLIAKRGKIIKNYPKKHDNKTIQ